MQKTPIIIHKQFKFILLSLSIYCCACLSQTTLASHVHYEYALFCRLVTNKASTHLQSLSEEDKQELNINETYLKTRGWKPLKTSEELIQSNKDGYFGTAYYRLHKNTATVLIAHRGTCFNEVGNIVANLQIMERKRPKILKSAQNYTNHLLKQNLFISTSSQFSPKINNIKVIKIIHTGFSLGGFIASACATLSNFAQTYAITFDSPGSDYLPHSKENQHRIINYVTSPNIVNSCNAHTGEIRKLANFPEYEQDEEYHEHLLHGMTISSNLDLTALQELFLTIETHNLKNIIATTKYNNWFYYKIAKWPVAKIKPIYGPIPSPPEMLHWDFNNIPSSILSIGALLIEGIRIFTAGTLWSLTMKTNALTGKIEGIIGFEYQRDDEITYSDS